MSIEPKTLQQAAIYFSNADNCISYLVERRWPDGVAKCPVCGSERVSYVPTRRVWQCKTRHPKSQFSIKVGTIFEDSAISLDKWLMAMWMVANRKNGISSHEIARMLGVTQKSAWFILHRVRLAMRSDNEEKMGDNGPVEVDETHIGPKPQKVHRTRRLKVHGAGRKDTWATVIGMLDR